MATNPLEQMLAGSRLHTSPRQYSNPTEAYYAEQEAALAWGIDQAVARGLIDTDKAELAKTAQNRTWWDDLIGFEKGSGDLMGSTAQGIIDVMSLGNYASAAATAATIKDPLLKVGQFKMGFSPSAFLKEFRKRPYYGDMVDSFWGGMALDIAMDPTTYLTFGVGEGFKVAASGIAKVGAKEITRDISKLTLTRHGEQIYHVAARELRPMVDKMLVEQNKALIEAGKEPMKSLNLHALPKLHDYIGKYIVENYDGLKIKAMQNASNWEKFKAANVSAVKTTAQTVADMVGAKPSLINYTVEDVFQETARIQQREIGVNFAGMGEWLTKHPIIGQAARAVFPSFNRTYGVPAHVVDAWHETKNSIKLEGSRKAREIEDRLKMFSPAQLELMTKIIEQDELVENGVDGAGKMVYALKTGEMFDKDTLDAVDWAKKMFSDVLDEERNAGFKIETLKNYVQRVYKTDTARNLILSHVDAHAAIPNMTIRQSFQLHRMIATVEDAAAALGGEYVEKNIGNILMRRQMASIKMRKMEEFYDYIKATEGITPMMVYRATNEGHHTASMLKKILEQQRPPKDVIFDFDQIYTAEEGIHRKLGFVSDEIPKSGERGVKILEYLSMDPVARVEKAKDFAKLSPTDVARTFRKVDFKFKVNDQEYNALNLLKMHYDPSSPVSLMDVINKHSKFGQATGRELKHFIRELDHHLRKQIGSPILHMFPDFMETLKGAAIGSSKLATKKSKRLTKAAEGMMKEVEGILRMNIKGAKNFVPQLPEELMLRAKFIRMRAGDMTDLTPRTAGQVKEIFEMSKKLGMQNSHILDVMEALIGHRSLGDGFTEREARRVLAFLGGHTDDWTKRQGEMKNVLFDDEARMVTFGERSKPVFEKIDPKVAKSRQKAEEMSLLDQKRKLTAKSLQARISQAEGEVKRFQNEIKELSESISKHSDSGTISKIGQQIEFRNGLIKDLNDNIKGLQEKLIGFSDEMPIRDPLADNRGFVSSMEFLERNADQLSEIDMKFYGRRVGFMRQNADLSRILPKDVKDAARAALKTLKEQNKSYYDEISGHEAVLKDAKDELLKAEVKVKDLETRIQEAEKLGLRSLGQLRQKWRDAIMVQESAYIQVDNVEHTLKKSIDTAREAISNMLKTEKDNGIRLLNGGQYIAPDGKIRDIIIRTNKNGQAYVAGIHGRKIAEKLAEDMVLNGRKTVSGWSHALADQVPSNVIGSTAGRYMLPKSTADFLEDIVTPQYAGENKLLDKLLMGYDWIQNTFKAPLLAPWFSTMARNYIGNVSLAYLKTGVAMLDKHTFTDFLNVYNYMLLKESPNYRKMYGYFSKNIDGWLEQTGKSFVKTNSGEDIMTVEELVESLGRRGVTSAWMNDEIFQFGSLGPMAERISGSVGGAILGGSIGGPIGAAVGAAVPVAAGKFSKREGLLGIAAQAFADRESYKMRNLFRFHEIAAEIPTRLMLAIHELKGGATVDAAAGSVRKFLNDYGELSVFERRIMRRIFPFYNFMKHALTLSAKSMFDTPGRLMLPYKIFHEQNVTGFGGDTMAMPEDVPDWFHQQLAFMGKDYDETTGELKSWVINGFNLPLQEVLQLTDIVGPGGQDITQLAGRTAFGATSVVEYLTNYDSFRGAPIYPNVEAGIKSTSYESGNSFRGSPEWLKKLVNFQIGEDGQARVNPKLAWLLGEIPTSRFINVAKKVYENDDPNELNYTDLSKAILGTSIYRYDQATMRWFENKNKVNSMATLLSNIQLLKSYDMDRSTFRKPDERKRKKNPLLEAYKK